MSKGGNFRLQAPLTSQGALGRPLPSTPLPRRTSQSTHGPHGMPGRAAAEERRGRLSSMTWVIEPSITPAIHKAPKDHRIMRILQKYDFWYPPQCWALEPECEIVKGYLQLPLGVILATGCMAGGTELRKYLEQISLTVRITTKDVLLDGTVSARGMD